MMARYRKRPVVVEAWMAGSREPIPHWLYKALNDGTIHSSVDSSVYVIRTPEGDMRCTLGDYIVRGVEGEIYPCRGSIFRKTYELEGGSSEP